MPILNQDDRILMENSDMHRILSFSLTHSTLIICHDNHLLEET